MKSNIASFTLEAFQAQAGIKATTAHVQVEPNQFVVTTDEDTYTVVHTVNNTPVSQFWSKNKGRHLTREEAVDLLAIIKGEVPHSFNSILNRLQDNLPLLGFSTPTPLMTEEHIKRVRANADSSSAPAWSLVR